MADVETRKLAFAVPGAARVSGLLQSPRSARACYVLAHGAGAGMSHKFLASVASELYSRDIATFRYQFPYMETGAKRPDSPRLAQATVRAAVAEANRLLPQLPLFAGGKSFGGRMTSQAQAQAALAHVRGLAFLGFPLHPTGNPSRDRGDHLFDIRVPMLFLQGTSDALADLDELETLCGGLGSAATLKLLKDANHSFHVPAKSGRNDRHVMTEAMDAVLGWMDAVLSAKP
jgi:predicted alpha/beta-hydrolase family hydrolase